MLPIKKIEDTQFWVKELETILNKIATRCPELHEQLNRSFREAIKQWKFKQQERPMTTREFFKNSNLTRLTFDLNPMFLKQYSAYDASKKFGERKFDILGFLSDYLIQFEKLSIKDFELKTIEQIKGKIVVNYVLKNDTKQHLEFYITASGVYNFPSGSLFFDSEAQKMYVQWKEY